MSEEDHTTQMSRLAAGAYGNAHEHAAKTNYVVHPDASFSDHNMTTYHHRDDEKHIVVAHRGTAPGSKGGGRDIQNDLAFMAGRGGHEDRMHRRKNKTEQILNKTGATTFHLTGHSLGGGSVNHTIANSSLVQDKLTTANTFNAAAHPFASNSMSVSKKASKRLRGKVTHNRTEYDAVSMGFKTNTPFGKVKTHKAKKASKASFGSQVLTGLAGFTMGGVAKKSLDAHGIGNFHD